MVKGTVVVGPGVYPQYVDVDSELSEVSYRLACHDAEGKVNVFFYGRGFIKEVTSGKVFSGTPVANGFIDIDTRRGFELVITIAERVADG